MAYVYRPPGCTIWHTRIYIAPGRKTCRSLKTRNWKAAKLAAQELEVQLKRTAHQPKLDATFQQVSQTFLTATKPHRSPACQVNYDGYAKLLSSSLNGLPVRTLTTGKLQQTLAILKEERGWSEETYNHYVRYLRLWAKWIKREGYTSVLLTEGLTIKKLPKRQRVFIPRTRWRELLAYLEGSRYYTPTWTALYTGFRLGTLQKLKGEDFNWQANEVLAPGEITKDGQPLLIPLHQEYRKAVRRLLPPTGLCFPGLSKRGYELALRKAFKAMGVWKPRTGVHTLRHSFARHILKTLTINILQYLLGHSDLRTTQLYLDPVAPTRAQMHRALLGDKSG